LIDSNKNLIYFLLPKNIMNQEFFKKNYKMLNEAQKQVVEQIY
jgi:hypothetical protein